MNRPEFTMDQAIAYQDAELARWKILLNDKVYKELHDVVKNSNAGVTDPYKVTRGQCLNNWLLNYGNDYEPIKVKVYYQPELKDVEWGELLYSFEVYNSLENAQKDFPGKKIIKYQGNDIEDPTYID